MKYHHLISIFSLSLLALPLLSSANFSKSTENSTNTTSFQQQRTLPYEIDFSSPITYSESLQRIRAALGTRHSNYPAFMNLFELRENLSNTGHVFRVSGLPNIEQHLDFVVAPDNLYLAGFVTPDNIYYRFDDLQRINHPDRIQTINLTVGSNYNAIERIAETTRQELRMSPPSLVSHYYTLTQHRTNTINREEARAILSFATVISEAIRFREIGRGFASTIPGATNQQPDYRLTPVQYDYTNNWGGLSEVIPHVTNTTQTVRSGRVTFNTRQETAAAVGITLNCSPRARNNEQCLSSTVTLNGVIWDRATLSAVIPFYITNRL